MSARAHYLISTLGMQPHPEGGYFVEIHRSPVLVDPRDGRGERAALTTIFFLLTAGEISRWHRVAGADEAWHFYEGAPLDLWTADEAFEAVTCRRLGPVGPDIVPVHVVRAGEWQAAATTGDYTLVGCSVGPGFDFADFAMLRDDPAAAARLTASHPAAVRFI